MTPESLVGLRFKATSHGGIVNEGTFDSFDSSTGKHTFTFDNGVTQSFDIKGDKVRNNHGYPGPFVFEGAESYFLVPPESMKSKCTEICRNLLGWIIFLVVLGGASALIAFLRGDLSD